MTSALQEQLFHRSYLYVSGSQPHRIERAYDSAADAVMIDLEDSVPAAEKLYAREVAATYTATRPRKPTYVRVNSLRSDWGADDVRAVAGRGLSGVRIAKTETPDEVRTAARLLREADCAAVLHLLLETASGLEAVSRLATASPKVAMIGIGEYDLRAELNCDLDGAMMDVCRTRVILASRAAGLASPCQGVYPEVNSAEGLLRSCRHGKSLGFVGRMAIHPVQLPTIHEVYTPTVDEIAIAVEICAAASVAEERKSTIVYTERGHMVAPPLIAAAQQVIHIATALNLLPGAGAGVSGTTELPS